MFDKQKVLDAKVQANDPQEKKKVQVQGEAQVEFVQEQSQIKPFSTNVMNRYVRNRVAKTIKEAAI